MLDAGVGGRIEYYVVERYQHKMCFKMRGQHAEFRDYGASKKSSSHAFVPLTVKKGKFWREVGWRRGVNANSCNTPLK